jgi:hypothetical protein
MTFKGGAIGFSPRQIDAMTLAEFHAVAKGYARANGAKDDAPSEEEYFEALAAFEAVGMA